MNEIFPVLAGTLIGVVIPYLTTLRRGIALLVVLSMVFGVVASSISGELRESWVYILVDSAQVAVAGGLMWVLAARWRNRAASKRPSSGDSWQPPRSGPS